MSFPGKEVYRDLDNLIIAQKKLGDQKNETGEKQEHQGIAKQNDVARK